MLTRLINGLSRILLICNHDKQKMNNRVTIIIQADINRETVGLGESVFFLSFIKHLR